MILGQPQLSHNQVNTCSGRTMGHDRVVVREFLETPANPIFLISDPPILRADMGFSEMLALL